MSERQAVSIPHPRIPFLSAVYPVPEIDFDQELYRELIVELPNGRRLHAPDSEPNVTLYTDLPNLVLGQYDIPRRHINIDVCKTYYKAIVRGLLQREDPQSPATYRLFLQLLQNTLAHEGAHWRMHCRLGTFPLFDSLIMTWMLRFLGLGILVATYILFLYASLLVAYPIGMASNLRHELLVYGFHLALTFSLVFPLISITIPLIWRGSGKLAYRLSWAEKYADRFAERTMADARWKRVVSLRADRSQQEGPHEHDTRFA